VSATHYQVSLGTGIVTAATEHLVDPLGSMGRILIMTADTDPHVKLFPRVPLAVSGNFSQGKPPEYSGYHDFRMTASAGISDIVFMHRGYGMVMLENLMLGMTVITLRQFFSRGSGFRFESIMNIFQILLFLLRVTACTVDINIPLPEVNEGVGINVTVSAGHSLFLVNILFPLFFINK
jgi:hypothetical protein